MFRVGCCSGHEEAHLTRLPFISHKQRFQEAVVFSSGYNGSKFPAEARCLKTSSFSFGYPFAPATFADPKLPCRIHHLLSTLSLRTLGPLPRRRTRSLHFLFQHMYRLPAH